MGGTLVVWGGNYDTYMKTRQEHEKVRRQADSKQKVIDKMVADGLTEKPQPDPTYDLMFPNNGKLAPPVLAFNDVSFSYSGLKKDYLFCNLSLGVDCDSRV